MDVRFGTRRAACLCLLLASSCLASQAMTHYWDCCKPSCGWDAKQGASRMQLLTMCDETGKKIGADGVGAQSACSAGGRGVTMCADQQPFYHHASRQWMGFVASQDRGTRGDCCDCY